MAFNKVQTQTEAKAFKFLKDQSTVLHTRSSNEITVNGVNVIVKTPEAGDVLCVTRRMADGGQTPLGADKQDIVWIKGSTVSFAQWPSEGGAYVYEPVGVCYKVRGGKAYCRFRSEVSRRWSQADRWLVTNTDAVLNLSGTVTMTVYADSGCGSSASPLTAGVNMTGTLRDRCIAIQTALAGLTGNTTVACQYYGPHDYDDVRTSNNHYAGDDGVMIISARFTADAWNNVSMKLGDLTLTTSRCIGRDIPADSTNFRANGGQQYWGGCNFYRFYDYYSANGRELSSAPTSAIDTDTPIKESQWTTNNAKIYRDNYGTYKNYLRSCMVQWPTAKGANGKFFDKGKEFTAKLAKAEYIDMSTKTLTYLYGPAHYCGVEVSANGPGLTSGNWWLPSSGEMIELMQDVTYGTTEYSTNGNLDPVNEAIYHLNNDTFDPSRGFKFDLHNVLIYCWSSSRYAQHDAYSYNGGHGYLDYNFFNWSMRPVVVLIPITAVNISQ